MKATTPGSARHPLCLDTPSVLWPKRSGQQSLLGRGDGSSAVGAGQRQELKGGGGGGSCYDSGDCAQRNYVSKWRTSSGKHKLQTNSHKVAAVWVRYAKSSLNASVCIWVMWVRRVLAGWVRQAHQGPKRWTMSAFRASQRSADRWEWKWAGSELILIWLTQLIQSLHSPVYMQTHSYTRYA